MVDNQHQLIRGYRDLTVAEIELVNLIKDAQRQLGDLWLLVGDEAPGANRRDLDLARTHFQEGFSAFVRAVARPVDDFERSVAGTEPCG